MSTNSGFNGSHTENPFWYQTNILRQVWIRRGCQSGLNFDAADNCRSYITAIKTMNCQDDFPSIPTDQFKNHFVLVLDLTSDFTAGGYWSILSSRIGWRTPKTRAKHHTLLWNTLLNWLFWRTELSGGGWQVWCWWNKERNSTITSCNKNSIVSLHSCMGVLFHSLQILFALSPMRILPMQLCSPRTCRGLRILIENSRHKL